MTAEHGRYGNRLPPPGRLDFAVEGVFRPIRRVGRWRARRTEDLRPCHEWSFDGIVGAVGFIGERFEDYTRWMYRSGRPNLIARPQNRLSSLLFGAGIFPRRVATLEVVGRQSGRIISMPVVIADWAGEEYLVSMLGERANWVKNVRAAGGAAALRRGRRERVRLEEVDVADRAAIIRRYAAVAPGGRPHLGLGRHATLEECVALAPQVPVFRIDRSTADPS